ncbi:MerR family transcriptional regulator [Fulvivirga sedimenti]|uniref:MerR family transcriptional regulator n=1 Tax=Fulvivirga sedimenti TaxID=2879465 RepID=A0A9X1HMP7_9BACT|nr:MerR family transcriptional regulator [Fulvivirga sedimenti]MCA6073658.1 MerR family transcriptional regulator [Fulvivirga sedimenti]
MGQYSIKELERLSGIKAHTIRIWEKRYNILDPSRTDTNIRSYSDEDLKKLLNLSLLYRHGDKISKLSKLSIEQLNERIQNLTEQIDDVESYLEQLTICMIEMDEAKFEKQLSRYILKFGFEKTVLDVVFPFLKRVGILWLSDNINPIQEHFISHLIRQKIIVAIDSLPMHKEKGTPKVMLFLPENELHEISLLFYHYLVRKMGLNTFYLGQHVPVRSLVEAASIYKPDYLISNFSYSPEYDRLNEYIDSLSTKFKNCHIYLTGYPIRVYEGEVPSNVHIFEDAEDLMHQFGKVMNAANS